MPKKKRQDEPPEEQVKRFREAVLAMIDAGELNPTEADSSFENIVQRLAVRLPPDRTP